MRKISANTKKKYENHVGSRLTLKLIEDRQLKRNRRNRCLTIEILDQRFRSNSIENKVNLMMLLYEFSLRYSP